VCEATGGGLPGIISHPVLPDALVELLL
jgi:hypothetical protein